MRVAVLSDLHLRPRDLDVRLAVLRSALRQARAEGARWVLNGGDTFDSPTLSDDPRLRAGELLARFFRLAEEIGLPWLVVAGNPTHDGEALLPVSSHPLFHVVFQPRMVLLEGLQVACLPWLDLGEWLSYQDEAVRGLPPEQQKIAFAAWGRRLLQTMARTWQDGGGLRLLLGHFECLGAVNSYDRVLPGSSLLFNPGDLTGTGAHRVLGGHVHRRQSLEDGRGGVVQYIGAFTQLRHDETGNPTGWALLDTDSGEMDWREVEAPRYFTVTSEDYRPEDYQPWDRVKVRGRTPPPVLDRNAVFEALPEENGRPVRVEEVHPDLPPAALLEIWLRHVRPEEAGRLEALQKLLAGLELPGRRASVWGNLDRLLRIRLVGIGPHRDRELSFQGPDGLDRWAVVGPTGSGKTLAVEAVLAAFYGSFVHGKRTGTSELFALATAEDSLLEVTFESAGRICRLRRKIHRRGERITQQAFLEQWQDEEWQHLAGPSPTAVESLVEEMVGPRWLLLGSVFLSQEAAEDLVAATDAPRMAFLRELIGRNDLDDLAAQAQRRREEVRDRLLLVRQQAGELPRVQEVVQQFRLRLEELEAEAAGLRQREAGLAEHRQKTAAGLEELEKRAQEQRLTCARIQSLRQALRDSGERKQRLERRLAELQTLLQEGQGDEEELARLLQLRQRREELQSLLAEAGSRRQRLEADLRLLQSSRLQRLRELQSRLEEARQAGQILERAGCAPSLLPCPLIDRQRILAADLEKLQQSCRELESPGAEEEELLRRQQGAAAEMAGLQQELTALPAGADLEAAISGLRHRAGARQAARAEAETLAVQADQEEQRRAALEQEIASLEQSLPPADQEEERRAGLREELRRTEEHLEQTRRLLLAVGERLGAARRDLELAEDGLRQAREAEEKARELQRELEDWKLLEEAFGRTGIPQLLIDSLLPVLEETLEEICREDYQGFFRLRLATQKTSRKGTVSEGLPILFCRRGREYDVSRCSEGEKEAVRLALRAALGLYQMRRARGGYRLVIMDEPMTGQSEEWREGTMRLLDRLGKQVCQMIVVTHMPSLAAAFPGQIVLGEEV